MDIVINNVNSGYKGLFHCESTGDYLIMPVLFINADYNPKLFAEYKIYGVDPEYAHYGYPFNESSWQTLGGGTGYSLTVGQTYHVEVDVDGSNGSVRVDGEVIAEEALMDYSYSYDVVQECYLTHDVYQHADATVSNILITSTWWETTGTSI